MADGHSTVSHVCVNCGVEFTGRKRKYYTQDCRAGSRSRNKTNRSRRAPHPIIDGTRKCLDCGEVKPLDEYLTKRDGKTKSGWTTLSRCNPCMDVFNRSRRKRFSKTPAGKAARVRERAKRKGMTPEAYEAYLQSRIDEREAKKNQLAKAKPARPPSPVKDAVAAWKGWLARAPQWWLQAYHLAKYRERTGPVGDDHIRRLLHPEWILAHHYRGKSRNSTKKVMRARLMHQANDGTLTFEFLRNLFDNTTHCAYCGVRIPDQRKTLDHLDPLSAGGLHGVANVIVVCYSCNSAKGNKTFIEWMETLNDVSRKRSERAYRKATGRKPQHSGLALVYNN